MVQIRVVRMAVHERCVLVPVTVGLALGIIGAMNMIMHLVVVVSMLVGERLVHMPVLMLFGEMQIHADGHERPGDEQTGCQRIVQ